MSPAQWLLEHGAHHDVVAWAEAQAEAGRADWVSVFEACPRGDWLLGIAAKGGVPRRTLVRACSRVGALVLPMLHDAEKSEAEGALEVLDAWVDCPEGGDEETARRTATQETHRALEQRANALEDPTSSAAMHAVVAALGSVGEPELAAGVAAMIVQASVLQAGDCAMMAVVGFTQKETADAVRQVISGAQIEGLLGGA